MRNALTVAALIEFYASMPSSEAYSGFALNLSSLFLPCSNYFKQFRLLNALLIAVHWVDDLKIGETVEFKVEQL